MGACVLCMQGARSCVRCLLHACMTGCLGSRMVVSTQPYGDIYAASCFGNVGLLLSSCSSRVYVLVQQSNRSQAPGDN